MYIIIIGGGKVGYNLTKLLLAEGHEVLLVEKDKVRFQELSAEFGEKVVYGDGAEVNLLKDAGANRADLVVAVTGEDEDNLVICQMAKLIFLKPRTVARINDPENEEIFANVGIDMTVNTTNLISALIGHKVHAGTLTPLLTLRGGNVEIVQIEIESSSPAANRQVKDLTLPKDSLLISIIRHSEAIIPSGDSTILPGDTVIAVARKESEQNLRALF
ncbi:MAG: NAD-binding protein [Candidatus Edwardsbacteria bacterium]